MENWSPFGAAGENHELDDAHAFVGSSSLQVRDLTVPGMDVFTPSLAYSDHAAVEEGMMDAHVRWRDRDFLSVYVRFVDETDHYLVAAGYSHRGEDAIGLYRTVDGTTELVDSQTIGPLSNGSTAAAAAGTWVPFRVTWRLTPGGAFEVRAFENAGGGEWAALGGPLVDDSPVHGTSGSEPRGGVGVGGASVWADDSQSAWYDRVRVYYERDGGGA
jgi:hypothetical protein